jgi:hypothetical protein
MSDTSLYLDYQCLPEDQRKELLAYLETLKKKSRKKMSPAKRKFGALKGKFKVPVDFNQPLDDFKDYI